MAALSEYELQRLEHIKRNQEFLARLGLVPLSSQPEMAAAESPEKKQPRPKIPKEKAEPAEPVRRSARMLNKKPDYTGETIDNFADLLDRACAARLPRQDTATDEEHKEALLEASREWLQASRDALLKVGLATGKTPTCADEWKREAELRWGDYVKHLEVDDWQGYVTSRMSTPPPPSPLDLLQEYYAHDAWQLLVCCVLMSRVSSWDVKHKVIAAFFEKYPTPSAVLDADPQDIHKIIYPLGLFENRMQSLVAVTERFLQMPVFDVGLEKSLKIYGIGEFSYHSYLLFCRDAGAILKPKDAALASFAAWRKKRSESDKKAGAVAAVEGEAEQSADAAAESSRGAEKAAEGGKQEHSRAENEATSTSDQAGAAPENAHGAGSEAASQSASKRKRKVEPVEKEAAAESPEVRRSSRQRKPAAKYAEEEPDTRTASEEDATTAAPKPKRRKPAQGKGKAVDSAAAASDKATPSAGLLEKEAVGGKDSAQSTNAGATEAPSTEARAALKGKNSSSWKLGVGSAGGVSSSSKKTKQPSILGFFTKAA